MLRQYLSLKEEIILRLPGFLLGRCDDAIVVDVEGIGSSLKIVYGCWNSPSKAKKLYGRFCLCAKKEQGTKKIFGNMLKTQKNNG